MYEVLQHGAPLLSRDAILALLDVLVIGSPSDTPPLAVSLVLWSVGDRDGRMGRQRHRRRAEGGLLGGGCQHAARKGILQDAC